MAVFGLVMHLKRLSGQACPRPCGRTFTNVIQITDALMLLVCSDICTVHTSVLLSAYWSYTWPVE